jgi:cytochrome c
MKKLALIVIAFLAFSCKKENQEPFGKPTESQEGRPAVAEAPEVLGKVIFEEKANCIACHQIDKKVIGPSIQEIAKIYKTKNGNMVNFLKGEGEAIVDPSQFAVMQANLEITKTFTEEELKAVEAYIYSNLK